MRYFDSYHLPTTLDEALGLLDRFGGRARVIAGGTDLLLDLSSEYIKGQRPHYAALVDITRLEGANVISLQDGWIVIGCGVTHAQIEESVLINQRGRALAEASRLIGGPQVRNAATLVGNVAHALPAADGTIALLALDAEAQVARRGAHGAVQEWAHLTRLFLGPGRSAVDASREIISGLRFRPTADREGSAFARIMRPQGVALPILAMAARLRLKASLVESAVIAAGPVAPVPFRANRTEELLRGRPLSQETLAAAQEVLLNEVSLRASPHRATREYRGELLPTLLSTVLTCAAERARTAA